jgi:hypothetical protein
MVWVKLFKPTRGRIAIFIILFALIALLDQTFLFFPESPLTYNLFGSGALPFILYLLVIPYIVSCIIPAVYIKEFRHARIHEFTGRHEHKKPSGDATKSMDAYEDMQERYARSLRKPLEEPGAGPGEKPEREAKPRRKSRPTRARKPRAKPRTKHRK